MEVQSGPCCCCNLNFDKDVAMKNVISTYPDISHTTLGVFCPDCANDSGCDADYTDSYSGEAAWAKTQQIPYEYACHEGNHALSGILGAPVSRRWNNVSGTV